MRKLSAYAACAAVGLAAGAAGAQQAGSGADTAAASGDGGAPLPARVASNLEQSDTVDATRIEVEPVSDIAVELSGRVPTNGAKQEASVVAIQSDDVQFVRNNLETDAG